MIYNDLNNIRGESQVTSPDRARPNNSTVKWVSLFANIVFSAMVYSYLEDKLPVPPMAIAAGAGIAAEKVVAAIGNLVHPIEEEELEKQNKEQQQGPSLKAAVASQVTAAVAKCAMQATSPYGPVITELLTTPMSLVMAADVQSFVHPSRESENSSLDLRHIAAQTLSSAATAALPLPEATTHGTRSLFYKLLK